MMKFWVINFALICIGFSGALAEEIKVAMGDFEPYNFADRNTGINTDLISAVFQATSYMYIYRVGIT